MLEVKNLSKIYNQKDSVPVRALTNVNISFPEKGMVFLLGKSGSGKSTLLNICSGLDSPSSGEIIVKGRSSKNFSQSDFDSYRNTFVGFIFQEYNILNDFSVEDNISLALELQDKPKDKDVIEKILEDIGLNGFAHRHPNTLSGGEKQRIAIARALIKNPQIIMADEPSGALDSETGTQIFEILKKMSKDKLVIVVSHDRDFAEQYGDRIIELKDGKVISDVSKVTGSQISATENIRYIGNLLHIPNGTSLNPKDFAKLQTILSQANHEILIALSEEDVAEFKKAKNITKIGKHEFFKQSTEVEKIVYKPEDSKFISSKLPFKHALRIGSSSIRNKPFRLALTSLLCIAAFTLFGLASTMLLYNSASTFKKSLKKSDLNVVKISKEYAVNITSYKENKRSTSTQEPVDTYFSQKELENLKTIYGNDVFGGVNVSYKILSKNTRWAYWNNNINAIAHMTSDNSLYKTIIGEYPKNNDEICISSYMANVLYHCVAYDEHGKDMNLETPEHVLGKRIYLAGKVYTITGIFNCSDLPEKYDVLKTESKNSRSIQLLRALLSDLESHLEDGLYLTIFTTESEVKNISDKNTNYKKLKCYQTLSLATEPKFSHGMAKYKDIEYKEFSKLAQGITLHTLDTKITSLEKNEIIVCEKTFYDIVSDIYFQKEINATNTKDIEKFAEMNLLCKKQLGDITPEKKANNLTRILEIIKQDSTDLTVYVKPNDVELNTSFGKEIALKIVGFWEAEFMLKNDYTMYVSNTLEKNIVKMQKEHISYYEIHSTKYLNNAEAFYSSVFLPYDHSTAQTKSYSELYTDDNYVQDDSRIKFSGIFMENLEAVNDTVKEMSELFIFVGIALAIFAALLLSNFISVSISQKQKDIGILRAIGVKGAEIFKIFFVETMIIVFACITVSTIASIIICNIMNGVMNKNIGVELFVFGIGSFVSLTLISIFTSILATYLPVSNAAKKKPIESIKTS